ncbi:MAG: basic amino acid ABC transporter substrate-binding protein [Christensenellaceae bacterium]|nr:basic amino acid ABC transporter substrate-binding protein [Christensenellaceae bacterium]
MKKLLALILSLVLLVGSMALVIGEESILVVTNPEYPPFEFIDSDGSIVGYDIDVMNEIAELAGLTVEYEAIAFDAVIPAVITNPTTIGLSGISITEERKLNVNFSEGYIDAGLALIVKTDSTIKSEADLVGKVIGVQLGTTSDFKAEEITGKDNVATYKSFIEAVKDLQGSKIDAVIVDKPVGLAILSELNDPKLQISDMELAADWYGIAVNKANLDLLDKINAALATMKENGFFDELNTKYFGN